MKLPTLYKRTTTGATQSWEIEIEENKFRTVSGQLDGKKITNNWTTCEGKNVGKKNETSGAEQATKEAEAKHQKKRDKGEAKKQCLKKQKELKYYMKYYTCPICKSIHIARDLDSMWKRCKKTS